MKLHVLKEKFLDIPEINVEKGYKYCVGNTNNYKKSLLIAIKSSKAKLPLMHHMLDSKEYEGLRIIAHTLVRIMDTVGADTISQQALSIETAVLNDDWDYTHILLSEFVLTLENFMSRLEIAVRKIDTKAFDPILEKTNSYINYDFTKTRELLKKDYSKKSSRAI